MILMTLKKKKKSCLLTLDMLETLLPLSVQIVIMHRDSPCTCHNGNVTTSEYDWVGIVFVPGNLPDRPFTPHSVGFWKDI